MDVQEIEDKLNRLDENEYKTVRIFQEGCRKMLAFYANERLDHPLSLEMPVVIDKRDEVREEMYLHLLSAIEQLAEHDCERPDLIESIFSRFLYMDFAEQQYISEDRIYCEEPRYFTQIPDFCHMLTNFALKKPNAAFAKALVRYGYGKIVPQFLSPHFEEKGVRIARFKDKLWNFLLSLCSDDIIGNDYRCVFDAVIQEFLSTTLLSLWKMRRMWIVMYTISSWWSGFAVDLEILFRGIPDPFVSKTEIEEYLTPLVTLIIRKCNGMTPNAEQKLKDKAAAYIARYERNYSLEFKAASGPRSLKHSTRIFIRSYVKRPSTMTLPQFVNCLGLSLPLKNYVLGQS